MAVSKTITDNGSKGHHTFTLEVTEKLTDDSTLLNTSYINFTFKISPISSGYDWSGWSNRISYTIGINGNTYTGNIPSYNGSSTVTLKSVDNIPIVHETDGSKTINISFEVKDNTGQSYTCGNADATDTMTLTLLHKSPELSVVSVIENDSSIGVNNLFVNNLSNKTFTVNYSFYDSATPSQLNIYTRNGVKINSTATLNASQGLLNVDFVRYSEDDVINNKVSFIIELIDSLGGKKRISTPEYNALLYFGVNLEKTACNIKRNGQASGEAILTLKGTWFNGQVGNTTNGLTMFLEYKKIGDQQTTYLSIPSSANVGTGNNIDVNWLLQESGVPITAFDKRYSYSIFVNVIDTVSRGLAGGVELILSKGVWLMVKFKDRVDFARLSIGSNEIYPNIYSTTETIIGIDNGELRYRKVIDFGSLPTANITKSVAHNITNLSEVKKIEIIGYDGTNWFPIPFSAVNSMYGGTNASVRVDTTNINIASTSNWSSFTAKVTLEYTKS